MLHLIVGVGVAAIVAAGIFISGGRGGNIVGGSGYSTAGAAVGGPAEGGEHPME